MAAQVPSISLGMKDVYEAILPLFVPPATTFTGPLLDRFAAAHDPLMESNTLFTNRTDIATVRVDLDGAGRTLIRELTSTGENQTEEAARDDAKKLLEEVKGRRLRMKLRDVCVLTQIFSTYYADHLPAIGFLFFVRDGKRHESIACFYPQGCS